MAVAAAGDPILLCILMADWWSHIDSCVPTYAWGLWTVALATEVCFVVYQ